MLFLFCGRLNLGTYGSQSNDFATQKDAEGEDWAMVKGLLTLRHHSYRTGALREAVTDPASYTINGQRLYSSKKMRCLLAMVPPINSAVKKSSI